MTVPVPPQELEPFPPHNDPLPSKVPAPNGVGFHLEIREATVQCRYGIAPVALSVHRDMRLAGDKDNRSVISQKINTVIAEAGPATARRPGEMLE